MEKHYQFIQSKLDQAASSNKLRTLKTTSPEKVDFFSNDYLGYSTKGLLNHAIPQTSIPQWTGATGSRLISGNHPEIELLEQDFADFMGSPAALLYNSGYMANVGLLSALGDKESCFVFDEHVHASIKEGMRLGFGQKTSFKHNDLDDLEKKLKQQSDNNKRLLVLSEGLFSMHGDIPDVEEMLILCQKYQAALIIDEAHSLGTLGQDKKGISASFHNHPNLFARVITFGKAAGGHGAMVLGSNKLRDFLINFSRAFIYTTAPSIDQVNSIKAALALFKKKSNFDQLDQAIETYLDMVKELPDNFSRNPSPIQYWQCADIPRLKGKVKLLEQSGVNCYAILSPTVKAGEERIRLVLHAFNTKKEIQELISLLNK
ncbi:pyridoxal phosphate-dependent aminotransferase family protein [Echinicola marina]|uniref:aminotransferase class I/II-fold pyridoxal phosphate-dependent enzyme n=1 Tax=Echinicola marina TaxID=2859768 RepID=UPI001CF69215|nr:pyridoxal phosphate-dependent aminotransferase family protein [Echinicola marina]UCS93545.1 pyridoxal phosphate-dependent aminotransferase family protein [Echinicola marina]